MASDLFDHTYWSWVDAQDCPPRQSVGAMRVLVELLNDVEAPHAWVHDAARWPEPSPGDVLDTFFEVTHASGRTKRVELS